MVSAIIRGLLYFISGGLLLKRPGRIGEVRTIDFLFVLLSLISVIQQRQQYMVRELGRTHQLANHQAGEVSHAVSPVRIHFHRLKNANNCM